MKDKFKYNDVVVFKDGTIGLIWDNSNYVFEYEYYFVDLSEDSKDARNICEMDMTKIGVL
jgi:hypothetical protein